ncbi:hypothetical protein BGX38DRAFT_1211710 [Terfezia claveryi]|nr:hypothetical protein BGX38DRAFT_1211710 [Terfezia claveryi]
MPSPPGNLPRHKEDIIRIIDLAFVKFERRLQDCLDEASERIVTEAETAQAYVKGQLSLLKSNILKGLDDPETGAAPRRRHAASLVRTEPPMKRTWPAENALGVSSSATAKKKTRYSNIGIDEARRELAAESSAQKQQLAIEKKGARKGQREKSAKKSQPLAEKGTADSGGKKAGDPPASASESSSEAEEEDESAGSEHDLYSTETESSDSEGYKTPPSPTPTERRESRTLADRKSDPRVSYSGAPIRGLQA